MSNIIVINDGPGVSAALAQICKCSKGHVDMAGVTYKEHTIHHPLGFKTKAIKRLVPKIKASDDDLFGSAKGKRAKRRNKK